MASQPLISLRCPVCDAVLQALPIVGPIPPASSFGQCLRRCETHGIGFSNSSQPGSETTIYRDPRDNVPPEVQDGFLGALAAGVNLVNCKNKIQKAAFSTSEDALTWTVFRGLQRSGSLTRVLSTAGIESAKSAKPEPDLLLWGAPVPPTDAAQRLVGVIAAISIQLDEVPDRRTEPDVILDFGEAGVVIIEVKYRSANEIKESDYPNWIRYLEKPGCAAFLDTGAIRTNGHYELSRNWRFAWEIARRLQVPVTLVNLGPHRLFAGEAGQALGHFAELLAIDAAHRFHTVTWDQIRSACVGQSEWLTRYLDMKMAKQTTDGA